jgi:predicted HTH transcriptional regulator
MLDYFLKQNESEILDFKQSVNNLHKIAKTIASFANSKGGKLIIGISDNKRIIGIDPEEEKYMLEKAGGQYCEPPIEMSFLVIEVEPENEHEEPKYILVAEIPESNLKPVKSLDSAGEWRIYTRASDKSIPASKKQIKLMEKGYTDSKNLVERQLDKNEKKLLEYLSENERITLNRFCKLINVSKRRATKIIVTLLLEGLLKEHNTEKETYFTR